MNRHKSFMGVLVILLAVLLAGCSMALGSLLPSDDDNGTLIDPTPSTDETTLRIYFPDSNAVYVIAETRDVEVQTTLAQAALDALLAGPEANYLARAFPAGTEVISLDVVGGIATVNFHEQTHVPGTAGEAAAIRSLVLTLTELDGVDQVQILKGGRSGISLGGHIQLDEPMSRSDVYDPHNTPEIVAGSDQIKLFWPEPDLAVGGGFHIWGIAQVPEANLLYELTAGGETVAEGQTTADDANWGSFFEAIPLQAGLSGDAVLHIYAPSLEDGSPMFTVEIPVSLDEPEVVAASDQIRVYAPAPNSTVSGSFRLWGSAQVFEGTVQYELVRDADGATVLSHFTTAWDWDWGTFHEWVRVDGLSGDVTLRLYSESAEDGSEMFPVEIPLTIE